MSTCRRSGPEGVIAERATAAAARSQRLWPWEADIAEVPYSGVPTQEADLNAPDDIQHIEATPASFGAQIGEGLQEAGSKVMDLSQFYSKTAADQATNNFLEQSRALIYGDPGQGAATGSDGKALTSPDGSAAYNGGFYGMRGQDALNAYPEVQTQLKEMLAEERSGLTTQRAKLEFDNQSRRYLSQTLSEMGRHADEQNKTWMQEVAASTISLKQNAVAGDLGNPTALEQDREDLRDAFAKQDQAKFGFSPEITQGAILKADQTFYSTQVRAALGNNDPARAKKALDESGSILASTPEYDQLQSAVRTATFNAIEAPNADAFVQQATADAAAQSKAGVSPVVGSAARPSPNSIGNDRAGPNAFAQPATPTDGVILTASNLRKDYRGLTIAQMAEKWAPASAGNDPSAWAGNVSRASGLAANAVPDLDDPTTLGRLVQGIGVAEKGHAHLTAFTPEVISAGVAGAISGKSPSYAAPQTAAPQAPPKLAMVSGPNGTRTQVNAAIADKVHGLITDLQARGYNVTSIGGYANRNVAGTNTPSAHSAGLALDINPARNPQGGQGDIPPDLARELAAKYGAKWGGDFSHPDAMHFSWASNEGGSVQWSPHGASSSATAATSNIADNLRMAMPDLLEKAQTQAEHLFPNEPDRQSRYVDNVHRRLEQTISIRDQQYLVDTHVVEQAAEGATSFADIVAKGPAAAAALNRMSIENPVAYGALERRFDANARGDSESFGTGFSGYLSRVLAPTTDPNRITNPGQLNTFVGSGKDAVLTNSGVRALSDLTAIRGNPQGEAFIAQARTVLGQMHGDLTFSSAPAGRFDPKGEAKFTEFSAVALPILVHAYKAGNINAVLNPKSPDYLGNLAQRFMRTPAEILKDRVDSSVTDRELAKDEDGPTIGRNLLKDAVTKGRMSQAEAIRIGEEMGYFRRAGPAPRAAAAPKLHLPSLTAHGDVNEPGA